MKQAVRDFWEALTAATPASWVGILVFCLFELAFCCWFFQPRRMARMNRFYVMETSHDEYADLSFRLIAFKYSKLEMKHAAFFGPSNATRSLIAHDDQTLSAELTKTLGEPAHFDLFTTNNQRIEDALQAVDQFPPSFKGIVVLQIHDSKDDYRGGKENVARNRRRLALPNIPSIIPLWRNQDPPFHYVRTGVFFLDNLGFFAARRVAAMRFTPVPSEWTGWSGRRDPEKLDDARARFDDMRKEIEEGNTPVGDRRRAPTFTKSIRVMLKLTQVLRRRGIQLLLVEAPRFPSRGEVQANRIEGFHDDAARFCAQTGAKFWDFNPDLDLSDSDFQDTMHLGSAGKRRQYTNLMMEKIAEVLRTPVEVPNAGKGSDGEARQDDTKAIDDGEPGAAQAVDAGAPN